MDLGKATRPLCFRAAKIESLESLGAVWRSNATAWMVSGIMEEYVQWFDDQMERPTLLLMDYFSAHILAYETFFGESATAKLRFTTVLYLPATSSNQPLNQGIIQNWKTHVRFQFLRFMVESFNNGKDPMTAIHVLRAIRWGIAAWENDVSATTIHNGWIRSKAYKWSESEKSIGGEWTDSQELMSPIVGDLIALERQGHIRERMGLRDFLNPVALMRPGTNIFTILKSSHSYPPTVYQRTQSSAKPTSEIGLRAKIGKAIY